MDEMKLKLHTRTMRGIAAKIASRVIKKQLGIDTDIKLHEITIEKVGEKIQLHLNVDAEISDLDLLRVTKLAELDEDE